MQFALYQTICLGFAIGCTLHNFEEAVLIPAFAKSGKIKTPFTPNSQIYWILTTLISVLIWIIIVMGLKSPDNIIVRNVVFAIAISMAANAIIPHFAANLILKIYVPGTITGILFNLPFGIAIIFYELGRGFLPNWPLVAAVIAIYAICAFGALFLWHFLIGAFNKKGGENTAL